VRAPLANILGLIPLMDYQIPTNPDNGRILNSIKTESERLDEMIHEINHKTSTFDIQTTYRQHY
jgi:hypothetical protein